MQLVSINGIWEWKYLELALVGWDLPCEAVSAGMWSQAPALCRVLPPATRGCWDVEQPYVAVGCPVVLLGAQWQLTGQGYQVHMDPFHMPSLMSFSPHIRQNGYLSHR